jgi:hypothetical protein
LARRHKPKWGFQGDYLLRDDGLQIYDEPTIDALCTEYNIPDDLRGRLRDWLEGSANVWRRNKGAFDDAPNEPEVSAALKAVDQIAGQLLEKLDLLDVKSAERLWAPDGEVRRFVDQQWIRFEKGQPYETETRFGQHFTFHRLDDGSVLQPWPRGEEVIDGLRVLRAYCAEAIARTAPGRSGQQPLTEALRMWAVNIVNLWEDLLERPANYSRNRGALSLSHWTRTERSIQAQSPHRSSMPLRPKSSVAAPRTRNKVSFQTGCKNRPFVRQRLIDPRIQILRKRDA